MAKKDLIFNLLEIAVPWGNANVGKLPDVKLIAIKDINMLEKAREKK
jgi:hypothetical protein